MQLHCRSTRSLLSVKGCVSRHLDGMANGTVSHFHNKTCRRCVRHGVWLLSWRTGTYSSKMVNMFQTAVHPSHPPSHLQGSRLVLVPCNRDPCRWNLVPEQGPLQQIRSIGQCGEGLIVCLLWGLCLLGCVFLCFVWRVVVVLGFCFVF